MRRISVLLAGCLIGALLTGTAAYSSLTGGSPLRAPFVAGGGEMGPGTSTSGFSASLPRDFSIAAFQRRDAAGALGILRYGRNGAPTGSTIAIDLRCISVDGNRAVVGGIRRGSAPAEGWAIVLVDNGPPGGPADQVSYAQAEPLAPDRQTPGFPGWPSGFPNVCPSPTEGPGADAYGAGFFDLHGGDVIVSASGRR